MWIIRFPTGYKRDAWPSDIVLLLILFKMKTSQALHLASKEQAYGIDISP